MKLKSVIIFILLSALAVSACSPEEQPLNSPIPRPDIPVTEVSESQPDGSVQAEETHGAKSSPFYNSYSITMEINPLSRKLMATEKISYRNQTGSPLDKIYIRFNINAFSETYAPKPFFDEFQDKVYKYGANYSDFTLTSITINSEKVGYEINGRNIGVLLSSALPPDSNIDITMQFECGIPAISHRIGANGDALWFGNFIPVVATYYNNEFVLDQYYPAGEPFVYEASNFDVTITTPPDYMVFGTGIEKITENETNRITKFTINMVRDFAFVVSNKYKTAVKTSESGVTINFHHYSDTPQRVNMLLDSAAMSVDFITSRAGTYPYQQIDIAETELFLEGASGFPCIIFIDSDYFNKTSAYDAVSNEIIRQWFSHIVGNNQIKDAWLGVGLASYLLTRMNFRSEMVDVRMNALYADMETRLRNSENYALSDDISVYESWQEYENVQQTRAMLMFHALYLKIGLDKWNELLITYYNENSFRIATKKGLVDTASNIYGEDLSDFFESWITWREIPNLP